MSTKKWQFDDEVASRFYTEATSNIPDYEKVIALCDQELKQAMPADALILDVGSAIGHTVATLSTRGWSNVHGLEKSASMAAASAMPDRTYVGDSIPAGSQWHAILINWTLHFIQNKTEFLQQVKNALLPGGVLIISDKVEYTQDEEAEYYRFKRTQGLSDEYIQQKAKALEGVMFLKPELWYFETLSTLGFTNVSIRNSRYMFKTFVCTQPK